MSNQFNSETPGAATSAVFNPWLFCSACMSHLVWVIPLGALLASIGVAFVFFTAIPEFESTTILQANHDFILSKECLDIPEYLVKNELPLIMSPVVMGEVLSDPELKSVPSLSDPTTRESEIRKRVKVSSGGTDNLLMISYRDTDKKQVAKVANAIAASYVQERRRYDQQRLMNLEKSLVLPIEQVRRNIEETRRSYELLSEKIVGKNPFASASRSAVELNLRAAVGDEVGNDSTRNPMLRVETAELVFVRKKLESETEIFDKLNARLFALRTEQGRGASVATRSLAKEPNTPIETIPTEKMLFVGGLAFLAPFLLALVMEWERSVTQILRHRRQTLGLRPAKR